MTPGIVLEDRTVVLVCDATFFRKRRDKDGLLIFYDVVSKKILWFKFIAKETVLEYKEGLKFLFAPVEDGGLGLKPENIESVTIDGKPGVDRLFQSYGIPVQMCHFHQKRIMNRYLTTNPKLLPSKQLQAIMSYLTSATEYGFRTRFNDWLNVNQGFIDEKTTTRVKVNGILTTKTFYTHKRLRTAVNSLRRNMDKLFTYQNTGKNVAESSTARKNTAGNDASSNTYETLNTQSTPNTPNTTNHVEGGVNPKVKELVRIHKGMRIDRRNKLIIYLLSKL